LEEINWRAPGMRIGEFKQIVDRALTENNQLAINASALYGGQAYEIKGYSQLHQALTLFIEQSWNDTPHDEIDVVLSRTNGSQRTFVMASADYTILSNYVTTLNDRLPTAMSVVDSLVQSQSEYTINIKLPESINSIAELQKFNERLLKIFKKFSITGEFKFEGFDSGSEWYQIVVTSEPLYKYAIGAIGLAIALLTLKKTYYDSETSRLAYKAAKRKDDQTSETKHLDEIVEAKIEDDSKNL
jgi:hypothetical protein